MLLCHTVQRPQLIHHHLPDPGSDQQGLHLASCLWRYSNLPATSSAATGTKTCRPYTCTTMLLCSYRLQNLLHVMVLYSWTLLLQLVSCLLCSMDVNWSAAISQLPELCQPQLWRSWLQPQEKRCYSRGGSSPTLLCSSTAAHSTNHSSK